MDKFLPFVCKSFSEVFGGHNRFWIVGKPTDPQPSSNGDESTFDFIGSSHVIPSRLMRDLKMCRLLIVHQMNLVAGGACLSHKKIFPFYGVAEAPTIST